MKEQEPNSEKIDFESIEELPFDRVGIQPDGSYVGRITSKGEEDWRPPNSGETLTTNKGKFEVDNVTKAWIKGTRRFYKAEGKLVKEEDRENG